MRTEGYQLDLYCEGSGCTTPSLHLHESDKATVYRYVKQLGWKLAANRYARDLCPQCRTRTTAPLLYWKACDQLSPEEAPFLEQMRRDARRIRLTSFQTRVGATNLSRWAVGVGYARDSRAGRTLPQDTSVKFFLSNWAGLACAFLVHNEKEHIWRIHGGK